MDLSEKGVFKMTLEEALRFIDPETDMDALAEVEYYNGFKGKEAAAKTLREASQMVVDFVRRVSWHDAKTPPPVHDESWENAGEKHCCIMSELVWVCCESRNTMKGWIENGKWYIEDGRPAADTPYGAVKFWAPLLEPPEVAKLKSSLLSMRFRRGMENVSSEEIFGAKRYANTMHYAPKLTETRLRLNTGSRSACCSTAGSKSRTKSANPAAGRARRLTKSESSSFEHPARMVQPYLFGL